MRQRAKNNRASERPVENLEPRVLLAADPVTADHPFWAIPRGSAIVDGLLNDADWANAYKTSRALPYRFNAGATVSMMWNDQGLFVGVAVADQYLWVDGAGSGAGNRWEIENDDSFTIYVDPDHSRDVFFQDSDRAFGVNLGSFEDPTSGTGSVRRYKWVKGNANSPLSPVDVDWFGGENGVLFESPEAADFFIFGGTQYKTVVEGTINDNSDLDEGWSTEIFLPWAALNFSAAPTHGQLAGMNFDVIFDDEGGTRNFQDNRNLTTDADGNGVLDRFDSPAFEDDHLLGVHSSYDAAAAGLNGPVNYAVAMFVDARTASGPATITGLTAANTTGYSTQLKFNAPAGTTAGLGHVSAYQIRTSTTAITTEQDWLNARVLENQYVPRLAGFAERLRVTQLTPSTTYFVAARAVDAAGNLGALSNVAQFTTQSVTQDTSGGKRVVPSPLGRRLITEDGAPYVVVGDHLGISWNFTRQLFPGDIWDNAGEQFINFNTDPSVEGLAEPYFQKLQQQGVTFMRLYLELQNVHTEGNTDTPNGLYWLENTPGQYNPAMRGFMLNVLEMADKYGIYILFSPFDTFSYDEAFGVEGPWASNFGGPLTDINDFFQNPDTLQIAKNRMAQVVQWANESPFSYRALGWETPSEWDSFEWTLNAEGEGSPGRETEFTTRSKWINELGAFVQEMDPNRLTFNSTITQDPRGPVARVLYNSRSFDALSPHFYTLGSEEPINNPDSALNIRPALEQANITSYWLTRVDDRKPLINGEWGMTRDKWPNKLPQYTDAGLEYINTNTGLVGKSFTRADDEANFRSVVWAGVASGQFGTPLRISTDELNFKIGDVDIGGGATQPLYQGFILTDGMRATEKAVRTLQDNGPLDWATFSPDPLTGNVFGTASGGQKLLVIGSADDQQAVLYVLQDGRVSTGTVTGGMVELDGMLGDSIYDIAFWNAGDTTTAIGTLTGVFTDDGTIEITLPDFEGDIVITLVRREGLGLRQRVVAETLGAQIVTFSLGLDRQPLALVTTTVIGPVPTIEVEQDVGALAGFRGAVVDMTAFTMPDGTINLAATDTNQQLWLFKGTPNAGGTFDWSLTNLTELIDAPAIAGDLTTYQPSWGSVHIAGLDARGHAINYWFFPDATGWRFDDLTALFDGPTMTGGLTGYVASWDGLNLAGLDDAGNVIVYWWAPPLGAGNWQTLNMTQLFGFTPLSGQLDAYVTNWGGLNIAGLDLAGNLRTYWWSPATELSNPGTWFEADISAAAGGPTFARGVAATTTTDGGINLLAADAQNTLFLLRFDLDTLVWTSTNASEAASAPKVEFPISAASAGDRLLIAGRSADGTALLGRFTFFTTDDSWNFLKSDTPVFI